MTSAPSSRPPRATVPCGRRTDRLYSGLCKVRDGACRASLPGCSISPVARRHTCSRFRPPRNAAGRMRAPRDVASRHRPPGRWSRTSAALSVSDRISRIPDRQVSPASRKRTCSIWRSLMARAQSSNTSSNAGAPPRTATHQADYSVAAGPRTRTNSDGLDRGRARPVIRRSCRARCVPDGRSPRAKSRSLTVRPSRFAQVAESAGGRQAAPQTSHRTASDAGQRVGRPPCGPRTAARSRHAVRGRVAAAPGPVRAAAWSLAARRWAFAPAGQLYRGRGRLILDHLRSHDARSPGSCRPRAPRHGAAAR